MSIKFENVSYTYSPNTTLEHHALHNINCEIKSGKVTAIVGQTGSGKSTLVQHLNALLVPTSGSLNVLGTPILANQKNKGLKKLRSKVGLVFQFPELQLFEETIFKDVSFGPKNFSFSEEEIKQNASRALDLVGIDSELWERSPLDLSGGQKRRVAIAGVLASQPEVLVLDEPTAGLDPQGSKDMMMLFENLNKNHGITIIMVTHDLNHVLYFADEVIQLEQGRIIYQGKKWDFFKQLDGEEYILPHILQLKKLLKEKGIETGTDIDLNSIARTVKEHGL